MEGSGRAVTGGRFALLIATSEYQDEKFRRLRAPAHDVDALGAALRDPAIGGFAVKTLVNAEHWTVMSELEGFFVERKPDDFCLLYFSCHGVKDVTGHLHFATTTTLFSRLAATGISSSWVNERLERSRARRSLVLLDCCYSGAFARGFAPRSGGTVPVLGDLHGRGRVVITASDAMEYAWEGAELTMDSARPSVFTSAVVTGLQTGAADGDGDGIVTVDELYDYVHEQVRRETPNQTPTVSVLGAQGDLIVARNPHRRPTAEVEPLPPELDAALFDQRGWVRKAAVERLRTLLAGAAPDLALSAARALERLAADSDDEVRAAAQSALQRGVEGEPPEGAVPATQTEVTAVEQQADVPPPQPAAARRPSEPPPRSRATLRRPAGMAVAVVVAGVLGAGAWRALPGSVEDGDEPDAEAAEETGEDDELGGTAADGAAALTCEDLAIAFERDGDVWTRDADGVEINRTEHAALDRQPTWSPARDALVFVSDRNGPDALHVLDLASGDVRQVTDDVHPDGDFDPTWHPDGTRVAFTRQAEDGSRDVFAVELSGPDAGRAAALAGTEGEDQRPAWSPEGGLVFHSHAGGTIDLHALGPDGGRVSRLTAEAGHSHFHPTWSPDGAVLAFARKPDGTPQGADNELYRVGVDGQDARPLIDGASIRGWDPHWCPAGGRVVYEDDSTGRSELYVVDLDAADPAPQQLTSAGGRDPAW